jgi:hypothetical protein
MTTFEFKKDCIAQVESDYCSPLCNNHVVQLRANEEKIQHICIGFDEDLVKDEQENRFLRCLGCLNEEKNKMEVEERPLKYAQTLHKNEIFYKNAAKITGLEAIKALQEGRMLYCHSEAHILILVDNMLKQSHVRMNKYNWEQSFFTLNLFFTHDFVIIDAIKEF